MRKENLNAIIPNLKTARLNFRPLKLSDAETLWRIYQHEGVLRYFPNPDPPLIEKVRTFVDGQAAHWAQHGYGNWGVLPEGQDEIIGWAGLQYLPELNLTEVGFLLDRPFWGKGYATEAALASIQYGFEQVGLAQITALVHPDNLASQRVIAKCGMDYVETLRLWGMNLRRYCRWRDARMEVSAGGAG